MKYVGLDTSVILRLLLDEPEKLAIKAKTLLDSIHLESKKALVSDLVISEAYFALHYHYDIPKKIVKEKLIEMLSSEKFAIEKGSKCLDALKESLDGGAGFNDRMIVKQYLKYTDESFSFDKKMGKLLGCEQIQ